MEAEETAELLVTQFFAKFGPPDTIHSDQGRTFEASLIGNLFELFGIEKTRTTPYHPQSNGLVERFNQTLPDVLTSGKREKECTRCTVSCGVGSESISADGRN
ncbi:hypothetical protein M514_26804, partial [Trichuris suis]